MTNMASTCYSVAVLAKRGLNVATFCLLQYVLVAYLLTRIAIKMHCTHLKNNRNHNISTNRSEDDGLRVKCQIVGRLQRSATRPAIESRLKTFRGVAYCFVQSITIKN